MPITVIQGQSNNQQVYNDTAFSGDNRVNFDDALNARKVNNVSLLKLNVRHNSYGEILVNWIVSDDADKIDHFLIICDFQGVIAPIGTAAKLKNISNYTFIDQETFTYIGSRKYSIIAIMKNGELNRFAKSSIYTKVTNIPFVHTIESQKSPNINPGLTNDIYTAGDFFIELPIKETSSRTDMLKINKDMKSKTITNNRIMRK